jgi:subtilisin family serine protease
MKHCQIVGAILIALGLAACDTQQPPTAPLSPSELNSALSRATIGINILLTGAATPAMLNELQRYGTVADQIPEIRAVRVIGPENNLPAIRALPFVADAARDAQVTGTPIDPLQATNFENGRSSWNLDAINVTNPGFDNRVVSADGSGVYVGVLDTGLLDSWRQYFPQERIAEEYAKSFGGGGVLGVGEISDQPNKWEHDVGSHGTHVTSTILGYSIFGLPVNGVAPQATVVPVKVLNQTGSGWWSVIAHGIVYMTQLKLGPLSGAPVVVNMSLGGGGLLDPMAKAAIDYAVANGVILVAAAGNEGTEGMGYPGAYAPVISVAATGWVGQWLPGADGVVGNWWWADDVADPIDPADFYIAGFSSRAKPGQDLDVAAPGTWVVGPYQLQRGMIDYFYLSGTSMASPHVAGIVALMAQQNPGLTAAQAESALEATAVPLPPGTREVAVPGGGKVKYVWGADATGHGLVDAQAVLGQKKGGKK